MALLKKGKPVDANGAEVLDNGIYASIVSFAGGPNGELIVREGEQLRGNHAAVRWAPSLFLPEPVLAGELSAARHRVWPDAP